MNTYPSSTTISVYQNLLRLLFCLLTLFPLLYLLAINKGKSFLSNKKTPEESYSLQAP